MRQESDAVGVARASCPGRSDGRKGHGKGLRRAHAPALRHGQDGHATTGYKQVGGQWESAAARAYFFAICNAGSQRVRWLRLG